MHFLGEQHGKGPVDCLFGWGCAWIEAFLQEHAIYGLEDLVKCYKAGAQDMVDTDPAGPKFHIAKFDPGQERPEPRKLFQCPNFLITRTYCLKAELMRGHAHGIRLTNHVFTDADGHRLLHWNIDERTSRDFDDEQVQISKAWRRGYWGGDKTWENDGPHPGDVNELVRRHLAQKSFQPQDLPDLRGEEALLSQAAARLQKQAAKHRRQTAALQAASADSSSSTSSSSASTTSSH